MTDEPSDAMTGIDRRAFLGATAALAGTAAALAAPQQARAQAPRTLPGGTVFTGDLVDGKPVVSRLNTADLEPGKTHLLYFRGVARQSGQPCLVSVIVARGARPGKRLTLTSGVHGDEMSSIQTVLTVMALLDPAQMAGTVMAVPDISGPAIDTMQRRWPSWSRGADLIDMNREWPGNENGATTAGRHAALLFNHLLVPNSDFAIDFPHRHHGHRCGRLQHRRPSHPRSPGDDGSLSGRHDLRQSSRSRRPAQRHDRRGNPLLHPGNRRGAQPGPSHDLAVCRRHDERAPAPRHHWRTDGPEPARDAGTYIGNSAFPVLATRGGFVEYLVGLDEAVMPGQRIAIQRNTFGEVVADYASSVEGKVAALRSDASAEPGNVLAFILFNGPTADAAGGYTE
jgi:predicted deacylase